MRYDILWIMKLANSSLVVSFIMLIPLVISLICVLCLLYDPPEVAPEDYYGPIDHALIRFKQFYGHHVFCYREVDKLMYLKYRISTSDWKVCLHNFLRFYFTALQRQKALILSLWSPCDGFWCKTVNWSLLFKSKSHDRTLVAHYNWLGNFCLFAWDPGCPISSQWVWGINWLITVGCRSGTLVSLWVFNNL